jgi:Transposase DDE domain group 1
MQEFEKFDLKFSPKEVTAWGGLALLKKMLDAMEFGAAMKDWQLPQPGSNRGYRPEQLIEQMIVSIWCGASRFAHAEITRLDATLVRIFGWSCAAGHKAIVRLFQRFDIEHASNVQANSYRWLFGKLALPALTLDVDSTVITRWGRQTQGGAKGYNPKHHGRSSHHPLLAFVADYRLVANFWLRPGNAHTASNAIAFLDATLDNLNGSPVGLFRADSGFYDKNTVGWLKGKKIAHILSVRITQALQQAIVDQCQWLVVESGLQVGEIAYQPHGWDSMQRMVVVRQHIQRSAGAAGKSLSLFADDQALQDWRYGVMLTDLALPALEVWRLYRGRADCENRIKELKADFGLDSFCLRDFWATEAALSVSMLAYNLMSVFRQAVLRQKVNHTLSTLHHKVLAVGAYWGQPSGHEEQARPVLRVALARKRRVWFEGLWARSGEFNLPVAKAKNRI